MAPYIPAENRALGINRTTGDLAFIITKEILSFLGSNPHFTEFAAALGALESAKLELYRRMIAPYEDKKCAENGDVYPKEK